MATLDYKKTQKELYQPKATPALIDVPEMLFLMVDGAGDPNTSPAYANALEVLYGLSYAIKMSKMGDSQPSGYFEYVVPPLEGLWSLADGGLFQGGGEAITDKSKFVWTAMIRQPEFVTEQVLAASKATLAKKKPQLDLSLVRLERFTEGLCAQVMHIGPYDAEPATIAMLSQFIEANGYEEDMATGRHHHEIYLSDPRRTAPARLRTVIRHPIRLPGGK